MTAWVVWVGPESKDRCPCRTLVEERQTGEAPGRTEAGTGGAASAPGPLQAPKNRGGSDRASEGNTALPAAP